MCVLMWWFVYVCLSVCLSVSFVVLFVERDWGSGLILSVPNFENIFALRWERKFSIGYLQTSSIKNKLFANILEISYVYVLLCICFVMFMLWCVYVLLSLCFAMYMFDMFMFLLCICFVMFMFCCIYVCYVYVSECSCFVTFMFALFILCLCFVMFIFVMTFSMAGKGIKNRLYANILE